MSESDPTSRPKLPPAVVAEAAAWLAILHGPGRTNAVEQGFFKWLQASADHPRAFEEVTEVWEDSRNLPRPARLPRPAVPRLSKAVGLAAAAMVVVAIGSLLLLRTGRDGVATDVGEQRVLTLEDGTQIMLNTATRVVVSYDERARTVELKSGEALFEVARHPEWPFVVVAGEQRIRALGTAFVVRREKNRIAVTLVHGKVAVTAGEPQSGEPPADTRAAPEPRGVVLVPGQRLTVDPAGLVQLDMPKLDAVLAWQRRELALDDVPLWQAVAEVNRYSTKPILLEQPAAAGVHVSGLFRTGDALSFARAVAAAYQLQVIEQEHRILLRGEPRAQTQEADDSA